MPPAPALLSHVLWLGGSPCAGKTSVAHWLGERYGLPVFHVDDAFPAHQKRFDPERHPTLLKWTTWSCSDLWAQEPNVLLQENIAGYGEHFTCVLEDLLAAVPPGPLLVEGSSLLPGRVAPWLLDRQQAIWFVTSEAFQQMLHPHRRRAVEASLRPCQDPEVAFTLWMERDAAFARWIAEETRRLGLEMLLVDGQRTIAENAAATAWHLLLAERLQSPR